MNTFIFGASGFAKEVDWLIYDINGSNEKQIEVSFIVTDDNDMEIGSNLNGISIISEKEYFAVYNKSEKHNCLIALGSPEKRKKVFEKINNSYTIFPTLIHPSVIFDKRQMKVVFGKGCIICAGSILTTEIYIGNFVHLNLNSTIGHDTIIGDFVTISPSVSISGKVKIGNNVFIGTGSQIIEGLEICTKAIIGAGAVVIKNIVEAGTYVGIPALKVR